MIVHEIEYGEVVLSFHDTQPTTDTLDDLLADAEEAIRRGSVANDPQPAA